MDGVQQGQQSVQHAPYFEMMSDKCKSPTAALTCPDTPSSTDHTVLNGQAVHGRMPDKTSAASPSGTEANQGGDEECERDDDSCKGDVDKETQEEDTDSESDEEDSGDADVASDCAAVHSKAYSIADILSGPPGDMSPKSDDNESKGDEKVKETDVRKGSIEPPTEQKLKASLPEGHPLKDALFAPQQVAKSVQDVKTPSKKDEPQIYPSNKSEAVKQSTLLSPSTDQYKAWLKQQQKLDLSAIQDDKNSSNGKKILNQLSPSVATSYLQGQAAANLWYQNMAASAVVPYPPFSGSPYCDPVAAAQLQTMYPAFPITPQPPGSAESRSSSEATSGSSGLPTASGPKTGSPQVKPKEKVDAGKMTKDHAKLYHCVKCPRYFSSLSKLVRHEATHPTPRLFNCGLNLKRKRTHDSGDTVQEKRKLLTPELYSADLMHRKSPQGDAYRCVLCSERCPSSAALQLHITQTHRKQSAATSAIDEQQQYYRCSFCSQFMASRADLIEHEKIHIKAAAQNLTQKAEVACKSCPEKFVDAASCKEHEKLHHPSQKFHPYPQSSSSGSSSTSTSPHQFSRTTHNGLPLFPEQMLPSSTAGDIKANILQDCLTQGGLKSGEEMGRHPITTASSTASEDIMNSSSERIMVLSPGSSHNNNNDMHSMNSIGEYSCPICKKQFVSAKLLKSHVKYSHLEERPYTCTICSKSFKQKATLKQHEKLHSDEKPYICNICSRGFVYPSRLKTHAQTCKGDPVMSP